MQPLPGLSCCAKFLIILNKPSPLGKRHIVVKVLWLIYFWVIDKDTTVKVSPPHVTSVSSSLNMSTTNSKSDSVSHWLPIAAVLTIMDPNQPKPLMKSPISIEQDFFQFHTSVLIDSATKLYFTSEDFLTRNNILGKFAVQKSLFESLMSRGFPQAKHVHLSMFR